MTTSSESQSPTALKPLPTKSIKQHLKIDWLTLKLEMKGEESEQIVPTLIGYVEDEDSLHQHGIVRGGAKLSSGTQVAFRFFVPKVHDPNTTETRPLASVRIKKVKAGTVAAFVDIHPPGLTPYGMQFVDDYLLRGVLNRTLAEISAAKVTRVDIALDLIGVSLGDFAWDVKGKRIRRPYMSGPTVRSFGFGASKHGSVAVYHKGTVEDAPWARIEARLRPGCPLSAVPKSANPFCRIGVADVRAAWKALGRHKVEGEAMLALAQLKGIKEIPALFADCPAPYGKLVATALKASTPSWWNPIGLWQEFPAAIAHAFAAALSPAATCLDSVT